MTGNPSTRVHAILNEAASLLDAIGADCLIVPAEVRLECLFAAALLEAAGGRATRVALRDGSPNATIRSAMTLLSQLDLEVFGTEPVLRAARSTRRALGLLEAAEAAAEHRFEPWAMPAEDCVNWPPTAGFVTRVRHRSGWAARVRHGRWPAGSGSPA